MRWLAGALLAAGCAAGGGHLASDAAAAERLARAAIERQQRGTAGYLLDRPESVQRTTVNGRPVWRIAYARKEPAKGGQLVVLLDAETGQSTIAWGE